MLCLIKKIETKSEIKKVDIIAKNAINAKFPIKTGCVNNT